jgi:UrcA family protein
MLKIVLLAAALSGVQATAYAAESRDMPVEISVSTKGVNFGRPAEVRDLHVKLARAAVRACDSGEARQMAVIASDQACAKAALDQAIARIDQPVLTAYHRGEPVNTKFAQR